MRSSSISPGGTARSLGLANAFGALGADPASISINPGGLGLYRTSELSLTPAFEVNTVRSTYAGPATSDTRSRFFFSNMALVLNSPARKNDSAWQSGTFGVVYDRQATHHWGRQAGGTGMSTSILDDLAAQATGTLAADIYDALPFTSALAYDAFAIDPADPEDSLGTNYVPALPFGAVVDQAITIDSRGATNNTAFFYSGNRGDRLYLGVSVGLIGYRYTQTRIHSETVPDEGVDLKDLSFREDLSITGNGVDVKAGVVYRFHDRFRAGLALHSPMWMTMSDTYSTSMSTNFRTPSSTDGRTAYSSSSPDGVFTYEVESPFRAVASAAYIAGEHGLVSVDYEYVDLARMRLRPNSRLADGYSFDFENQAIGAAFRKVHRVRAGTEWRSGNWYFRMGVALTPDAYLVSDPRHGQAERVYAGGLGYRTRHLSVDLGANYIRRSSVQFPYDRGIADPIREERHTLRTLLTVALRP